MPVPVEVNENPRGQPVSIILDSGLGSRLDSELDSNLDGGRDGNRTSNLNGSALKIDSIADVWRVDDEWWRDKSIVRLYYRVITQRGGQITIFRDLVDGGWYRQNT